MLTKACNEFKDKYGIEIDDTLGVLADPAGHTSLYGIREDFLIPSACLNSTVCGLISRTVLRSDIIGASDFHGAKFYKELIDEDESNNYINMISSCFCDVKDKICSSIENINESQAIITMAGSVDVKNIKEKYGISDINFIKPGLGETTRVLLRRVPEKILVKDKNDKSLAHILILAKEKGVQVIEENLKAYKCCGIIKSMKDV